LEYLVKHHHALDREGEYSAGSTDEGLTEWDGNIY